jgi:hypothetical protein
MLSLHQATRIGKCTWCAVDPSQVSNSHFFRLSTILHLPTLHQLKPLSSHSAILSRVFFQDVNMKIPVFVESAVALLLAGVPITQGAPVDAMAPRDFSADIRNFGQIQQLMYNLRSRIGIPFYAMRNVRLSFNQTLEVKPIDLVLLPSGYCFSCSTPSHGEPDYVRRPNPFRNEMVELDELQILVACTDDTEGGKPNEWPLMKACPGQEKVLREFLLDVSSHSSRLAVPKARLENAPVFEVDKRACMPRDPKQTTCSTTPSLTSAPSTGPSSTFESSFSELSPPSKSSHQLQNFISSIYQPKSISIIPTTPTTTSTGISASTKPISASAVSGPNFTKPEVPSTSSFTIASSTSPIELMTSISSRRQVTVAPFSVNPTSWNDGNHREAAILSWKLRESELDASRSAAEAAGYASGNNNGHAYYSALNSIKSKEAAEARSSASAAAAAAALTSSKGGKRTVAESSQQQSNIPPSSPPSASFTPTAAMPEVTVAPKEPNEDYLNLSIPEAKRWTTPTNGWKPRESTATARLTKNPTGPAHLPTSTLQYPAINRDWTTVPPDWIWYLGTVTTTSTMKNAQETLVTFLTLKNPYTETWPWSVWQRFSYLAMKESQSSASRAATNTAMRTTSTAPTCTKDHLDCLISSMLYAPESSAWDD